jgi:hypothetical protein
MENVPELLRMTGFLKSSLMLWGYKTALRIIRIRIITPIAAKVYLRIG